MSPNQILKAHLPLNKKTFYFEKNRVMLPLQALLYVSQQPATPKYLETTTTY